MGKCTMLFLICMYCNIKSCIVFNTCKSDYFACDNGVREGENLFRFLFSLFLNDLETFLEAKNATGLEYGLRINLRRSRKPAKYLFEIICNTIC